MAAFPAARVEVAPFETWPLPPEPFDAVLAATAFHWVDPGVRVAKATEALRAGGKLITISTHHVAGGDMAFFAEVQACYACWMPRTWAARLPTVEEVPQDSAQLDASGQFGPARFRRYEVELRYSAAAFVDLLLTYSDHLALPDDARAGLLGCVADLIVSRYGGQIRKRYLYQLRVAARR